MIFDEVITGFRVAAGGAQERYQVFPDVTILSKALGGGYPVAAFGASRELMGGIVNGPLFHGGVYSGNAVVMAVAEAVLDIILEERRRVYRPRPGQHGRIPPAGNVRWLTQAIDWDEAPVFVRNAGMEWPDPSNGAPRRAGVNAFGLGGLNAHVVLDNFAPGQKVRRSPSRPF